MDRKLFVLALLAGCAVAVASAAAGQHPPVTLAAAREAAFKAFPGKIVSEELERERGGSGLRYSFDIRGGTTTHEVGIDANTGALLENSVEGSGAD
ncbi:MAG: PepSY domain-containing protein [Nevskia sp.]|nr:PepSY domain-containing protein [Nevskia sp.]